MCVESRSPSKQGERNRRGQPRGTSRLVSLDAYIDQTIELLSAPIEQRGLSIERDFRTDSECVLLNGAALARRGQWRKKRGRERE